MSEFTKPVKYCRCRVDSLDYVEESVIEFDALTKRMLELYSKKNMDYGGSFDRSLDEDGLLVVKIRLGDKIRRLNQLIKSGTALVDGESLVDTLIDLANYSAMSIMWIEKQERRMNDEYESKVFADGVEQDI